MNKALSIFRIIVGLVLTIDGVLLVGLVGLSIGAALVFAVGMFSLCFGVFHRILKERLSPIVFNIFSWGVCAITLFTIALTSFITTTGIRTTVTFKEDAVIVLGAGIKGETVIKPLIQRLNKCIEYTKLNPDALIVVSGGQGSGESIPEAEAMKRYLIAHGVTNQIIKEDQSRNTYENMLFSKTILDQYFSDKDDGYKAAFITNDFHIYRSRQIAKLVGMELTHYPASVDFYLRPPTYLRETLSIVKFWVYD